MGSADHLWLAADRQDEALLFRLPDGRDLAYLEWGAPDGFPVFYCHGTPSSRLEAVFADPAARAHNFRLIAVDRPGFGRSSFQDGRHFIDWPRDIEALADGLAIAEFGIAGHSGAGPHLFACGALLDPARLKFIGALAPWGPAATPDIASGMNRLDRFFARIARDVPAVMRPAFAPMGWMIEHWPRRFFAMMESAVSPADKAIVGDPAFADCFGIVLSEAFRQGGKGAAHEAAIAYGDWGFDTSSVRAPTHIWLGEEDIFVPRNMGAYIARTVPDVDFHWIAGKGHLMIEHWHDILAACKADLGPN
ncbi:MAG: alpha/beta hydrolase [Pseudomonadota bacterium]